ncbi:MAG: methionine synthase [Veillonella sp.]|nr:methionine synthase [Veillonella sp.]
MPIYNGMLPVINKDEVKRYAGLRHAEDFPEKFVDEACKEIQLLATPKGVYQEYDYDAENKVILSNPPLKIEGSIIEKHLEKSTKVYVLGVTVGEDVERRSEQLFKQGNYTVGLLLDAAATTAVEQVADQVNEVINNIAKKQGYAPTWRFSPGYGNWPLEIQPQIIGLMPGDQCLTTKRGCSSCSQKDCQSRKLPEKAAATKPETSKTAAETSGIAMKAQPTE